MVGRHYYGTRRAYGNWLDSRSRVSKSPVFIHMCETSIDFLAGYRFMKNVYTVFDLRDGDDTPRIGFHAKKDAQDIGQAVRGADPGFQTVLSA